MPTRRDAATLLGTLALLRPAAAQVSRPLVVFAAASLQTALDAIAAHWKRETGKSISLAYAASSALARQIDQGAPADLFASADQDWMDWAAQRQLIQPGSRRTLLENTLVLVEPASLPPTSLSIAPGFPLAQMLGDGRLAIGQIPAVPAGRYAREALGNLQVWEAVARNWQGQRMFAPPSPGWHAARPGSESFMPPMPGANPGCGWSPPSLPAATRPSSIHSPSRPPPVTPMRKPSWMPFPRRRQSVSSKPRVSGCGHEVETSDSKTAKGR